MRRKITDFILNGMTYIAASLGILILIFIIAFSFIRGFRTISIDFIFGTYKAEPTWVRVDEASEPIEQPADLPEDIYWSSKWGIGIRETVNSHLNDVLVIEMIDEASPLRKGAIKYTSSEASGRTNQTISVNEGVELTAYYTTFRQPAQNANLVIEHMNASDALFIQVTVPAGGIRGAIITTLMMIVVTLAIAVPFGVCIAIYLNEYARKTKSILMMRSMIDMLAGIPSIVYGIVGVLLFFRYFPLAGDRGGYTILGGAFTLVAILLPVIIRSTEEALLTVPMSLREGSLALGATKSQTILKVVLPNALPGILTAILLSIGRIIGESAALILVSGTMINDAPRYREGGATLAVFIWKEMAGEQPNVAIAAGVSLIIIFIVLILNLLVKLTTRYLKKSL